MGLGEVANFAAYSFAPAILVTPLGALSVIVGAILASIFLGERIHDIGKAGCALCLLGSVVVVLNAPEDGEIVSVDQILNMAVQWPFLIYGTLAVGVIVYMIFKVAPTHGTKSPLVYLTICSLAGSLTVTACKGFGIALKLTLSGHNQFKYLSTYIFAIIVVACIMVQMNYFNKALDQFSTNVVTPIYYVFFTTATIFASVMLFQGFTDSTPSAVVSLLCGFLTIFIGVFLLNSVRDQNRSLSQHEMESIAAGPSHRVSRHFDSAGSAAAPPGGGSGGHYSIVDYVDVTEEDLTTTITTNTSTSSDNEDYDPRRPVMKGSVSAGDNGRKLYMRNSDRVGSRINLVIDNYGNERYSSSFDNSAPRIAGSTAASGSNDGAQSVYRRMSFSSLNHQHNHPLSDESETDTANQKLKMKDESSDDHHDYVDGSMSQAIKPENASSSVRSKLLYYGRESLDNLESASTFKLANGGGAGRRCSRDAIRSGKSKN
ncbi:hypothetical protein H4219_004182 [Mycoemilia scoparia]|uniref:DUF803-domain-containing protein n=1 Tax=Mycoemilia scoparia TaxID=417184 RepID=A0A9W8DLU7_9FUNG|nr:hypothetical protein H4219_004182 [Mycoemilia scoparia]